MTDTAETIDKPKPRLLKVLIVDDHPIVISGCRAMLFGERDMQVFAATNGDQALELFGSLHPSVVVLDINLPGVSGFEVARRMLEQDPQARILFFSMNDDPIFAARSLECGAKGYITKNDDPADFIAAIRKVEAGEVYLRPDVVRRIEHYRSQKATNPLGALSQREIEILRLLARGKSMPEIAHLINLSHKTVANACTLMKNKVGARSPMDLVRIAHEHGLV
jgi:two-component system invasion response regulator UvrY